MRYLVVKEFKDFKGRPFPKEAIVNSKGDDDILPSFPDVILLIANSYAPSQEFMLQHAEVNSLNKAADALEEHKSIGSYIALEDEHFRVLENVVNRFALRSPWLIYGVSLARSADIIKRYLAECPSKEPKEGHLPSLKGSNVGNKNGAEESKPVEATT